MLEFNYDMVLNPLKKPEKLILPASTLFLNEHIVTIQQSFEYFQVPPALVIPL